MIPDLSVVWVVILVLALSVILERLLFRPVMRVIHEREGAVRSAREMAEASAAKAQEAAAESRARIQSARAEVYREMDETRRRALERRAALVASTRQEVEATLVGARARLQAQAQAARDRLDRDADALATAVMERVLGRRAP